MGTRLVVCSALVAASLTWLASGLGAADTSQLLSKCQGLLTEQWKSLSKGEYDAANKTFDKARQEGCLQRPVADQLCAIPAEQEKAHDKLGNATLVDMARNQQRLLGCQM